MTTFVNDLKNLPKFRLGRILLNVNKNIFEHSNITLYINFKIKRKTVQCKINATNPYHCT